jgi:Tol biopolymer transport system component
MSVLGANSYAMSAVAILCAVSAGCQRAPNLFYASAEMGTKLIQIEAQGSDTITTRLIGQTGTVGCISLALSPSGTLYSMCGPGADAPGPQQLATIDLQTGHANPFGMAVSGLTVMALKFSPGGTLYAVGDINSSSPTFNSLYTVDAKTGAFTRVGATGAPSFFMDFAFDSKGTMYAATSIALYTIDTKSGTATKVVDFVGSNAVMGLAFSRDGSKLYATDFKTPTSDFYLVDTKTGRVLPIAATGYANSHNLVLENR